jgi:AP-3 complex subunit beta
MALRVLSGIKVPNIGGLVVLAIKKCAADTSPYVRTVAALAIPKCYKCVMSPYNPGDNNFLKLHICSLDSTHQPVLTTIISTLLRDRSPFTVGSVAVAFDTVCPSRLDLLHQHYRRLCRTLVDMDEWGQVSVLNLLARYAKTMLPRPTTDEGLDSKGKMDPDLQLLLISSQPLLQSQNPAVSFILSTQYPLFKIDRSSLPSPESYIILARRLI